MNPTEVNARIRAAAKSVRAGALVWVDMPEDEMLPGAQWAYAVTVHALGRAAPDGHWQWFGSGGNGGRKSGEAASFEAAKAEIERRYAKLWEKYGSTPISDEEKLRRYRQRLIHDVGLAYSNKGDERYEGHAAIEELDRAGWLADCPEIDQEVASWLPTPVIFRLNALGKIIGERDELIGPVD